MLTSRVLALLAAAVLLCSSPFAAGQTVDAADVRGFELSTDLLRRFMAANRNLNAAMENDPTLLESIEELEGDPTAPEAVGEMIAAINAEPSARRAVENGGISVRDFALTNATLIPAAVYVARRQAGLPGSPPDWLSPQHLRFAEQNAAEIQRLFDEE
jgi:hypothetical protein